MNKIEKLAIDFRKALENALKFDELGLDFMFKRFPRGCCGDTSYLLAEYLLENGIETSYVCGTYINSGFENMQSHAWLIDENEYIIDITGDQFKNDSVFLNYNKTVYVGKIDKFHKLFEVEERNIHKMHGLSQVGDFCYARLRTLYNSIIKQL